MTSYASRKMILQLFLVIDMETEKGGCLLPSAASERLLSLTFEINQRSYDTL